MKYRSGFVTAVLTVCLAVIGTTAAQDGANPPGQNQPIITGTVSYLARIALPPDATLRVSIEDVSRADAPSKVIASKTIATEGKQVPIAFELPYEAGAIEQSHSYVVRAVIDSGERMLFTSTRAYPVITRGAPTSVEVRVDQVGGRRGAAPAPATLPAAAPALIETHWNLLKVEDANAAPMEERKPYLTFSREENRLGGMAGVNQFFGTYQLDGNKLSIKTGGMTMMAGPEPLMQQEQKVMQLLEKVDRYEITGKQLTLIGADKPLLVLEAGE